MTTDLLRHDRYRVEQRLGTGAMGTVVLAHDSVLDRRVAVKVLADHLAADEAFRQRFLREARLAARLCHPNIVQVYDAGEDGRPFLVMEYVDGETVADRLTRGARFSPDEVLTLATDLSGGLAHAHAMGIVHRDVKPHNVLLGPSGVAKLADFGIARALEDHGFTEIGTVLGTAHFMAPEQAAGAPVGPPADVFALGAVLRQVAGDAAPTGLEPLIEAALAPDPNARPSAADLHASLSAMTETGTDPDAAPTVVARPAPTRIAPPTRTGPPQRESWRKPAAIALAALAVIVLLLALFPRENRSAEVAPVPTGADPAQAARNLATWLRDQGD
jgi:tRNA A-37 threonylcarbamoyl transferase component Bud32